jgi:hypothetical protein
MIFFAFSKTGYYLQLVVKNSVQNSINWWWPVVKKIQAVAEL